MNKNENIHHICGARYNPYRRGKICKREGERVSSEETSDIYHYKQSFSAKYLSDHSRLFWVMRAMIIDIQLISPPYVFILIIL